jgi:transcriptional regulator with XRE-family HTH domain
MSALVAILKEKMIQKKISAHALEKRAGLKASAVHNILSGRSKNPSIFTLHALAQALDCSVSDLIDEEKAPSNASSPPQEISWDSGLYLQCFELVNRVFQEQNLYYPKDKMMSYVDEIYTYSLGRNKGKVDEYFAHWLINRSLKDSP